MKNRNRITIVNIISISIVSFLGFISGPIFSGKLGTEGYGIFSVYLVWVNLSRMVFSLGAENAIPQANVDFGKEEQNKYHSSVLSLGTLSYFLFSLLTIILSWLLREKININILLVICGLIHGWGLFCFTLANTKYIYEFSAIKNAILSSLVPFLSMLISFLIIPFFAEHERYIGRVLGEVVAYGVVALVLSATILMNGKELINIEYWTYTLPITLPLVMHLLSGMILSQCDRIMIQKMLGNSDVGIYSLAYVFSSMINSLLVALNHSWVPFFYDYQKNGNNEEIRIHSKNYIQLFAVITSGFILLSKEIYGIYANRAFRQGDAFIPIFALSYYLIFLYGLVVNYEMYYKKTKLVALGTTFSAVVNVLLNFFLIRKIGVIGALIATVLSSLVQLVFHWFIGRRIVGVTIPYKNSDFLGGMSMVVLAVVAFYICNSTVILRWSMAIILGVWMILKIIRRKEIF